MLLQEHVTELGRVYLIGAVLRSVNSGLGVGDPRDLEGRPHLVFT